MHLAERSMGAQITLPGFKLGALPLAKKFASQFTHL